MCSFWWKKHLVGRDLSLICPSELVHSTNEIQDGDCDIGTASVRKRTHLFSGAKDSMLPVPYRPSLRRYLWLVSRG